MKTEKFISGKDCLSCIPDLFKEYFGNCKPLIVADKNTWKACGEKVHYYFVETSIECGKFIFENSPFADMDYVNTVHNLISKDTALVSVGSGTINDLCKLASFKSGKSYISVCTAPSVDGYNSFGAAINVDGYKKTVPCDPPVAVVADMDVLSNAPYEMLSSGYGDLYAKIPAGADWMISDILGTQKVLPKAWNILHSDLKMQLSNPQSFGNREPEIVNGVFKGLINSGLAIQILNDSRPASGAEHLISHMLEMEHSPYSHGHKVAVGTLVSLSMENYILV